MRHDRLVHAGSTQFTSIHFDKSELRLRDRSQEFALREQKFTFQMQQCRRAKAAQA